MNKFSTILSRITELDNLVKGFKQSELVLIGARLSVGKTLFALSMISNIAIKDKKPVGYFSLEMNSETVVDRLLFCEGNFISNPTSEQIEPTHCNQLTAERIYEAPLYIEDTPNISLQELKAKARRLKSEKHVEIIFIDYLTLITSEKKSSNKQVAGISSSLKSLADELNIPIIVLVQVKRNDKGLQPTLMDIRGSESIVGEADTIIFLHKLKNGKTELILAKHRTS